jgi:rhodanese-related sulfurtransferase
MLMYLLFILGLLLGWDLAWWLAGNKPLFPWQLKKWLAARPPDLVILDVRTPLEYRWFHLPGAINVPQLATGRTAYPPASPSQEIVVTCMTGHRSQPVAYALQKRGYPRVHNLTWGMVGWKIYEFLSRSRMTRPPATGD